MRVISIREGGFQQGEGGTDQGNPGPFGFLQVVDEVFSDQGIPGEKFRVFWVGEDLGIVPGLIEIIFPDFGVVHVLPGEEEEGDFRIPGGQWRWFLV